MKTIEKDELFENVRQFLKGKGIELAEGSYAQTIQKSCRILADVVNLGQQGLDRAKSGIDRKLDQVREVIHRKTAPKPPRVPPVTQPAAASETAGAPATDTVGAPGAAAPDQAAPVAAANRKTPAKAKRRPAAKKKSARKPANT